MQHRIRNRFGTVAIFIGRRRFPLVRGNVSSWCLLVVMVEEVAVFKVRCPFRDNVWKHDGHSPGLDDRSV